MRIAIAVMVSIVFSLGISCGVYTFSPSALGGIKSVAIPLFENQTTEGGISEKLTDGLAQAFVTDNTLRVVPEGNADSVLRGSVVSYSRDPYTYDESETVTEYIVTIDANVQFVENGSGKTIWEERFSNWGTYNSAGGIEDTGQNRAIDKLVEDILNRTVKGW